MPFVKGHKQSVGNKGGGRKTKREEIEAMVTTKTIEDRVNARLDTVYNAQEMVAKIKAGTATSFEIQYHNLMMNNPGKIWDKISPTKQYIEGEIKENITVNFIPAKKTK